MILENQDKKTEEVIADKEVTTKKESIKKVKELSIEDQIVAWKKQYGKVYKNSVNGEEIIWRPIRRKEYRELLNISEELEADARLLAKQEATTLMGVLFPANIAELIEQKAGLATVMSEEILAKSGFDISETEAL